MADFSEIKTEIQTNIKTNGNQEITGAILQDTLINMVDATEENITELEGKSIFLSESNVNGAKRIVELYLPTLEDNETYHFSYLRWYTNNVLQARIVRDSDGVTIAYSNQGIPLRNEVQPLYSDGPYREGTIVGYILPNITENDTSNATPVINVAAAKNIDYSPSIREYIKGFYLIGSDSLARQELKELYLANLKTDKRYYFKFFRWYVPTSGDPYPQVRIYEYSSENKSDERMVALISGYSNIKSGIYTITPNTPDDDIWGFCVAEFISESNTTPEINVEFVSDLHNSPIISASGIPMAVIPRKTYVLSGEENTIYHANYLSYFNNSRFSARIKSGTIEQSARFFRVKDLLDSQPLEITLVDMASEKVVGYGKTQLIRSTAESSISPRVINIIGDSFTYNGMWYQQIANILQGLSFVGMRKSYNTQGSLRAEGRGGWTLADYFNPHNDITPTHMQPFSPFVHVTGYQYYGVVEFWKAIVNDNSQYTYGTNGFDDYKEWFNNNGYKAMPSVNDLMYNGTDEIYQYWNGSSWVEASVSDADFSFNYSKYIETWNIAYPDIVMVMLGKNDFYAGVSDALWTTWRERLNALIDSIKSYSENIKIGICTPTTANTPPYSDDMSNYQEGHHYMWEARRRIITCFDNVTNDNRNVFVVDTGICLDPEYGFNSIEVLPFAYYEGNARELYGTSGVHPSNGGYKQLGICAAAFIQNNR